MTKTIYRTVTAKRRTARAKAKPVAPFRNMLGKLNQASAALSAARGRR